MSARDDGGAGHLIQQAMAVVGIPARNPDTMSSEPTHFHSVIPDVFDVGYEVRPASPRVDDPDLEPGQCPVCYGPPHEGLAKLYRTTIASLPSGEKKRRSIVPYRTLTFLRGGQLHQARRTLLWNGKDRRSHSTSTDGLQSAGLGRRKTSGPVARV